ncbi:MAG: ABC transporter permease subunit [Planctomycetaceae bacterium]
MNGSLVIVERELPGLLRTRQALWVLFFVAFSFAVTVYLKWPSSATADLAGVQAGQAFRGLAYAMLLAVLLVVPAFPATGLIREVRRGTMELLLNSPLRRTEIYFGKLLALMGFAVLLLVVTTPAMSCCYAMGGISIRGDVAILYLVLLMLCLQLVVLGLLVGTFARTPESGLRWVYGATFALTIVTVIPHQFLQGGVGNLATAATWLRQLSAVPAVQEIVGQSAIGGIGLMQAETFVRTWLIATSIFVVVGSVWCVQRLNYSLMDRSRSQGIITDELSRGAQIQRRLTFLVDPQKRKAGIPFYLNPVMMKEFRSRQFGRLHWLLRLIAGCAVLSLLLTLATTAGTIDWGVEKIGGIIIIAQVGLIVLFTPGLSGGMLAGELETGGWDLLRATPLSAARILRGKLISVTITLVLVLCASLPGYAIIMVIKPVMREQVAQVLICLVFTAVLSLLISATVSSFFRTTAAATTVAYGILIGLLGGTMLVWLNRESPFSHSFVERVLTLNPMAGALNAMRVEGFEDYNLVPATWWAAGALSAVLLVILHFRTWQLARAD